MTDWFRTNRALHRDVGYLICGLTIIYSVSGIAVNHIDSWNPTYSIQTTRIEIGPLAVADLSTAEREVVSRARLDPAEITGRHLLSSRELKLFLDHGGEVRVDPQSGNAIVKRVSPRPFLFSANKLHLNSLKGTWTYFADLFAIALLYMAISGVFMLRGRNGPLGRGKWLLLGGIALPGLLFLFAN